MQGVLDEQIDIEAERAHRHRDAANAWLRMPVPGPWVVEAACAGSDPTDFLDPPDPETLAIVRRVCAGCPVLLECDSYAITARAWGVWGGQLRRAGKPA
jgi:hypothetical protein